MSNGTRIYVGTAGWSIPRASAPRFDGNGTHLERYARGMHCAEINSSFHRPHAAAIYEKWRASTPQDFRFAVKLPRAITHDLRLRAARAPLSAFLAQTDGLGQKRGPLLVQLPPSFEFDARAVARFFTVLRERVDGPVVCEPRHPTWFAPGADEMLVRFRIARVAADPPCVEAARVPGGWRGFAYFRLHGSPRTYWSRYELPALQRLAENIRRLSLDGDVWCIFDNTASGAALENAWELQGLMPTAMRQCAAC